MDTYPITARSLEMFYYIKGDQFERAYKNHLSGFRVTMDFSESMRAIVLESFPYATITIDRFHVMKEVLEAVQQIRIKHKQEARRQKLRQGSNSNIETGTMQRDERNTRKD